MREAIDRAGKHVCDARSHEILPDTVPHAACPPIFMARPHWPQMLEFQFLIRPRYRNPAEHPASMAINSIPHQLAHEPADLLKTFRTVEFHHADGIFIAAFLVDLPTIRRFN